MALSKPVERPARAGTGNLTRGLHQTRELLEAALERVDTLLGAAPGVARKGKKLHPGAQGVDGREAVHSLAALRAALGWSRGLLGSVLNCSERALVNWEHGEPVSPVYAARARELQGLYQQLASLMKPEEVGPWLNTEMEEFEGRSPADLIRRGETGRLWESIYYLRSGQPD